MVGLGLDGGADFATAVLAVWKAGGAYLPLDPSYPAERLAHMIEDAAAPVLLTQESVRRRLPPGRARLLCLDADWPAVAAEGNILDSYEACPPLTSNEKTDLARLIAAERERLTKDLAKFEKGLTAAERQLGNEAFMAKAPAHIVEGLRKQSSETKILYDKTKAALDALPPE